MIASSALYSVVPSLSIVVGLFSLAAVLGIPWSWFRLSVVGSVTYELMAADMVGTAAGYESIAALNASGDSQMIGTIMFVMSICIMGGIVGSLIFTKGIQKGLNKAHDKGVFGILATNVLSLAMLCAYVPILRRGAADQPFGGGASQMDHQNLWLQVAEQFCYGGFTADLDGFFAALAEAVWLMGGMKHGKKLL